MRRRPLTRLVRFLRCNAELQPLTAVGWVILQLALIGAVVGYEGEPAEWRQYMALGALFPLLCYAWTRPYRTPALRHLRRLAHGVTYVAAVAALFYFSSPYVLVLLLPAAALAMHAAPTPARRWGALLGVLGWGAGLHLVHWAPAVTVLADATGAMGCTLVVGLAVFATASRQGPALDSQMLRRGLDAAVACLFVWMSLRPGPVDPHHWGYVVGPAGSVQTGGVPLWDVPAQYGFFNTVLLSQGAFASPWQKLYLLQALMIAGAAWLVYRSWDDAGSGYRWKAVSAAVAAVSCICLPGRTEFVWGAQQYPNVSGFRFLLPMAVLGIALAADRRYRAGRSDGMVWRAGFCLWALSLIWSSDVGVWCTCIWGPTAWMMRWRTSEESIVRSAVTTALTAAATLLATAAATVSVYALCYGHLPDFFALIEFAASYKGGFMALPMAPDGVVWAVLLPFAVVTWASFHALQRPASWRGVAAASVAAPLLIWALSSYVVDRSHAMNLFSLTTPVMMALGAVFQAGACGGLSPAVSRQTMALLSPIAFCLLIICFGHPANLQQIEWGLQPRLQMLQTGGQPRADAALSNLFIEAQVHCDDRVNLFSEGFLDPGFLPTLACLDGANQVSSQSVFASWLPFNPTGILAPLSPERHKIYLERALSGRGAQGGWLLFDAKKPPREELAGVEPRLRNDYELVKEVSSGEYRLVRYVRRGGA